MGSTDDYATRLKKIKRKECGKKCYKYTMFLIKVLLPVALFALAWRQSETATYQTKISYLNHLMTMDKYKNMVIGYYEQGYDTYKVYDEMIKRISGKTDPGQYASLAAKESEKTVRIKQEGKCSDTKSGYLFLGTFSANKHNWPNPASDDITSFVNLEDIRTLPNKLSKIKINKFYSAIRYGHPVGDPQNYEYCELKSFVRDEIIQFATGEKAKVAVLLRSDNDYDVWIKIIEKNK